MARKQHKIKLLERRIKRIREKVRGTAQRPRLSVFRSSRHIYAQVIDDDSGRTLAEASSVSLKIQGGTIQGAEEVGKALGERAKEKSVETIRFDRRGRLYHGRVKALADAARKAGLQF